MKAVILAGGEGTRLRPLTLQVPKPVVPIANVPFLGYQLNLLHRHGISEAILSLGYRPDKIEAVLGDGSRFRTRLRYVVERSPLGTAGAFKNAEPLLDGPAVVFNGDILCDFDLTEMLRSHRRRSAVATLALTRVDNPSAYGLVETGEDGRITRFLEKPGLDQVTCNTINAGLYVLEPEVLKTIPVGVNTSFERAVFPGLLASGQAVYAYISPGYWMDIGTPQKYLQAHRDILQGRFVPPAAGPSIGPAAHLPRGGFGQPRGALGGGLLGPGRERVPDPRLRHRSGLPDRQTGGHRRFSALDGSAGGGWGPIAGMRGGQSLPDRAPRRGGGRGGPGGRLLPLGLQPASPHFSPGGVIMAQEFFPQRVLASEERSGHYVRGSMCALREKGQARARPAPSVAAIPSNGANQGTEDKPLSLCIQRPGEKCGLVSP